MQWSSFRSVAATITEYLRARVVPKFGPIEQQWISFDQRQRKHSTISSFVRTIVPSLLVQDGIQGNGGFTSLTITNDQFFDLYSIGTKASTDFKPVCIGSWTDLLGKIPGALT